MAGGYVGQRTDEGGRIVETLGAPELEAEFAGGLGEGDVDVVEDLDVVAEEADGLEDYADVALVAEGGERFFDGGADPGAAGDALALEGEEPGFEGRKLAGGGAGAVWKADTKTNSAVRLASTG